jgi:hypothetical protein
MTSERRETRLRQKAEWEVKLKKRLTLLAEQGLDERQTVRDARVRELKAKIGEADARIRAIDAKEKLTADLAAQKAEKLAAPKEEPPKKKVEEPPPETKPKKKKKKEGEVKPQQA